MRITKRGKRWVTTIYNPQTRGKVWVSGATREECKANVGVALDKLQRQAESRETIETFARQWVDLEGPFSRRRKPQTISLNTERIKPFRAQFGHRKMASITPREAMNWSHENIGRFPAVRAMFSDAKRLGLIHENPFADLQLARAVKSGPVDAPTPVDVAQMVAAAKKAHGTYGEQVYGNLIILSAYTGLRPGELYALEWGDVDLKAGEIQVKRQFNQATRTITPPKYDSYRTIALLDEAIAALEALPRISSGLVVFTPTGKRFSGAVQHYYWSPVRNLISRPEWVFYSLRHAYGTYLASLGLGPFEIAKAMGHRDNGATAMRHYVRMAERDVNDRIRQAARRARFTVIEGSAG